MTSINLLPWRETAREINKKKFLFALTVAAVMTLLFMVMVHFFMNHQVATQKGRNDYLQQQITHMAKKIKEIKGYRKQKEALISRMNIIQELQTNRPMVVHFFDELVDVLPQGMHLAKITRIRNKIILNGFADSNTNVSSLMRHIDVSLWIGKPFLSDIKTGKIEGKEVSEFNVELSLTNPQQKRI